MTLSLSNLKPAKGAKSHSKRLGRGNASGKGTTAGKGTKGQRARTGGRNRLKFIGLKRFVLQTPKLRGFQSGADKAFAIGLDAIDAAYKSGETVSPKTLFQKGLVPPRTAKIKLLGGKLRKKLVVAGCLVSEAAKDRILAAGGEMR